MSLKKAIIKGVETSMHVRLSSHRSREARRRTRRRERVGTREGARVAREEGDSSAQRCPPCSTWLEGVVMGGVGACLEIPLVEQSQAPCVGIGAEGIFAPKSSHLSRHREEL